MSANVFARLEAACADVVERTFATAFPSALQPVQIARKLVAAVEASGNSPQPHGRRFIVHLHPSDYARLAAELPYLERQWTAMLAGLVERSRRRERAPEVLTEGDASVGSGTVSISTQMRAEAKALLLRVRKGLPLGAHVPLDRPIVIGRDPGCDLVLVDPRASRRHVAIDSDGGVPRLRDLGSSNGTVLCGERVSGATLACGDVIVLGDTELVVDAADERAP